MRTLREYEKAGVAVIQLEDQVMPKKCGHMIGRQVIAKEEMLGKIKAAVDTRQGDMMIMARTDARTVMGIDEAIERGIAYREAGADIVFIESPREQGRDEAHQRRGKTASPWPICAEGCRTPML
jgi:2-methylisocitrate lyase-like PEP mutase family enzyme